MGGVSNQTCFLPPKLWLTPLFDTLVSCTSWCTKPRFHPRFWANDIFVETLLLKLYRFLVISSKHSWSSEAVYMHILETSSKYEHPKWTYGSSTHSLVVLDIDSVYAIYVCYKHTEYDILRVLLIQQMFCYLSDADCWQPISGFFYFVSLLVCSCYPATIIYRTVRNVVHASMTTCMYMEASILLHSLEFSFKLVRIH